MIYFIILILLCLSSYLFLKDYTFRRTIKKIKDFNIILERYSKIEYGYAKEYKKLYQDNNPQQLCLQILVKYNISANKKDKEKCKTLVLKIYSITKAIKRIIDLTEYAQNLMQIDSRKAIEFSNENKTEWDQLHVLLDQLTKDVKGEI
jgi:hypothetical protein